MARLTKKNKSTIIDALLRQGENLEIDLRESATYVERKYDISADALSEFKDTAPKFQYRKFYSITTQSDEWKEMYQDLLDLNEALFALAGYQIDITSIQQEMIDLNKDSLETLEYLTAREMNLKLSYEDFKNTFGSTERENLEIVCREFLND